MTTIPENWTTADIPDMSGKVAVITGANSGIGYEMSHALAGKGAEVIMACRSMQRGEEALGKILKAHSAADVTLAQLDLADLSSVRRFVEVFKRRGTSLHILINNAGVMGVPRGQETTDGFEIHFGVNHLSHFALTGLLLENLLQTPAARVVTISSTGHHMGRIDLDNLDGSRSKFPLRLYVNSKLANLLFMLELQRRAESAGVELLSLGAHPGWTATNLQVYTGIFNLLNPLLGQSPQMGALPALYAAVASGVEGGGYYGPDRFFENRGHPKAARINAKAQDPQTAARLWQVSEKMAGITYRFV